MSADTPFPIHTHTHQQSDEDVMSTNSCEEGLETASVDPRRNCDRIWGLTTSNIEADNALCWDLSLSLYDFIDKFRDLYLQ